MAYDFQTLVDRSHMGSSKWEQMKRLKPDVSPGVVPFSVADMELRNPPEIVEGLKAFLDETILGYTLPTAAYLDAVCGWMQRRHGWTVEPDWIVEAEGVVGAFFAAVRAFTRPGEGVILQTPAYYPFFRAIERNGRRLVRNPLVEEGGRYRIDYEDLERSARDPANTLLLFCSPHNPTGRVWTREELERVGEICLRNGVRIVSDEIHFDLVMPGHRQTVFASVSEELARDMIVCTAPSKTFNLAGMHASNIIIPDAELRDRYRREVEASGFFSLSILGYKACELAYTRCESWLDELIAHVQGNHLALKAFIESEIPAIKVYDLEGTYLQWMDFRGLGLDRDRLERELHEKAELFFDEGYIFGEEGSGFERMNLACPRSTLMEALERLAHWVGGLGS